MQPIYKAIKLICLIVLLYAFYVLLAFNGAVFGHAFEIRLVVPWLIDWQSPPITLGMALAAMFLVGMWLAYFVFAYEYYVQRAKLSKTERELKNMRKFITEAMNKDPHPQVTKIPAEAGSLPVLDEESIP